MDNIDKGMPKNHQDKLLTTANTMENGERNVLMIKLGLFYGLRPLEITGLSVSCLNFDSNELTLTDRQKRPIKVLLKKDFCNDIFNYIQKQNLSGSDYIFTHKDGSKISIQQYVIMFRKIFINAGLPFGKANGGYIVHDLRRTYLLTKYLEEQ